MLIAMFVKSQVIQARNGGHTVSPAWTLSIVLQFKTDVHTDHPANQAPTFMVNPKPGVAVIFIERLQKSRSARRIYMAGSTGAIGSMSIDRFLWF